MRYISVDDLLAVVSKDEQIDLSNDLTTFEPDDDIVSDAILRAESIIDSYLSTRYTVPVVTSTTDTPYSLRDAAQTIAKYVLFERRHVVINDALRTAYLDRIDWLEKISEGKLNLVFDIGGSPNLVGEGAKEVVKVGTYSNTDDKFDDNNRGF